MEYLQTAYRNSPKYNSKGPVASPTEINDGIMIQSPKMPVERVLWGGTLRTKAPCIIAIVKPTCKLHLYNIRDFKQMKFTDRKEHPTLLH